MQSEIYTGRASAMSNSPWLASTDLIGLPPANVVIEAVILHFDQVLQDGKKHPEVYALKFKGVKKQAIVGNPIRKALCLAFSADCTEWVGKHVTLYVQDGVQKAGAKRGTTTTGIRLRATPAQPKPFSMPSKPAAVDGGGPGQHEKPTTSDETSPVPHPEPTEAAQARAEQS